MIRTMSDSPRSNKENIQRAILGEDWCDSDPKEGLNHQISVSNKGHIPGMDERWESEIDKRKRQIQRSHKIPKFIKWIPFLAGFLKTIPQTVSGEDIAIHFSIAPVQKLVKKLKKDPFDYQSRLKLVNIVLEKDQDFPIEAYRDLFLQAAVALSFNEISVAGVQLALKAQRAYLERLQGACRHESRSLFKQIKLPSVKEDEIRLMQLRRQYIHLNIEVLEKLIKGTYTDLDTEEEYFKDVYQLPSLKQIRLKEEGVDQSVFKYIPPLVGFLRFHTLLLPNAHTMPDLLIKVEKKNAIGHFLKGIIYLKELDFQLFQLSKGQKSEAGKKKIQELFKQAYHSLSEAVKQAGGDYEETGEMGNDLQILFEYVFLIRYFIKTIANAIQIPVPKPWARDNLNRAILLLDQTELHEKKILDLRYALEEDLKLINGK